jgi:hypothetical protein
LERHEKIGRVSRVLAPLAVSLPLHHAGVCPAFSRGVYRPNGVARKLDEPAQKVHVRSRES